MIPAKIDSVFTAAIQEKGVEAVVDWFDRHKQSFYALGWFYLGNQQQMEELFYRSILKVHKELPRNKSDAPFDIWVTSIFIHYCHELSREQPASEEKQPRQDLVKALDQLEDEAKEALLLTYVKGCSFQEAASILQLSVDKMKTLLFSATQSVRSQFYGATYNGCKEYHDKYIDYLEKSMDRPEKIEFEKHLYHCEGCQEDLATFQDVTLMLHHAEWKNDLSIPSNFMESIKKKLMEKEEHKKQKRNKRKRIALVFASVFVFFIGIGFFTGAFASVYYAWTEEDQQLQAFLQQDFGQRLSLEAESGGVKIKIKGVVADDFQTLVFYEIEDTAEDNQYFMNYEDGLFVENENEIMNNQAYPGFYLPDLEAEMNKKEKNIFYGKVALRPLIEENGVIKLKITKLRELNPGEESMISYGFMGSEYKTGEWNFEVPVTKQPSTEYALKEKIEIEGIPVRFEKLTAAPTATILQIGVDTEKPEKRMDFVNFSDLEVNNKKVKTDRYGGAFSSSQQDLNWVTFQAQFDPLYGEKPKEMKVHFDSAYFTIEDDKSIPLDVTQPYPQTFEYAGSTISIDKIEVGQPTRIVVSNHEIVNREFESLHLSVMSENENEPISTGVETEGVIVDKNGTQYDRQTEPIDYEKLEQPRHFITVQKITLEGNKVIPKRLDIFGYNTTKYLDDVVEISLE